MNSCTKDYPYEIMKLDPEEHSEVFKQFNSEAGIIEDFVRVGPKGYWFPHGFAELAQKLYNMEVRPDDVWVITFPKSEPALRLAGHGAGVFAVQFLCHCIETRCAGDPHQSVYTLFGPISVSDADIGATHSLNHRDRGSDGCMVLYHIPLVNDLSSKYSAHALKQYLLVCCKISVCNGKAGGWREYFDEEMLQQAQRWMEHNLRDTDLTFPSVK
ncbi:hypothetical protein evm_002018 [Chilo suppressalis]|nr:hypothetical protein evm_002018 [Chilo suppressalis]